MTDSELDRSIPAKDGRNATVDELVAALDEERKRVSTLHAEVALRDQLIAQLQQSDGAAEIARLNAAIRALKQSTSWQVTAPLRALKTSVRASRRFSSHLKAFHAYLRDQVDAIIRRQPKPADTGSREVVQSAWRPSSRNILVVEIRIPTPDVQSSGVRIAAILDLMREMGFGVTYVSDREPPEYRWIFDEVNVELAKRLPQLEAQGTHVIFGFDRAVAHLKEWGAYYEAAFVCYPDLMLQYAAPIRLYSPRATLLYDTVDLHGVRYRRAAELSGDVELCRQADRYARIEEVNFVAADRIVAITPEEAAIVKSSVPNTPVEIIPNIHDDAAQHHTVPGPAGREGVLFIGHYLHTPNADAAAYLVREIIPALQSLIGNVPVWLVGSSPTPEIKALGSGAVRVTGYVPDVIPFFDRARVFVAPLRFGAGMKGKIGQSMSLGLPVVTTSIGAEGFDLRTGEHAMLAETVDEFVAAIARLYRDDELWRAMSSAARRHIADRFSREAVRPALERLLGMRDCGDHPAASLEKPVQLQGAG